MKLIKEPSFHIESITLQRGKKRPSFFDVWRTDEEKEERRNRGSYYETFPGRSTVSTCIIEDTNDELILGEKIEELIINEYKMYGVLPIMKEENEVECAIDHCEILK